MSAFDMILSTLSSSNAPMGVDGLLDGLGLSPDHKRAANRVLARMAGAKIVKMTHHWSGWTAELTAKGARRAAEKEGRR